MELASKILVIGGLLNLVWGFVTGNFMAAIRMKKPEVPKPLRLAHIGTLMWAPILFGLVVVLPISQIGETWELVAAVSMVVSSLLLALKDTLYWLLGTHDEFAKLTPVFVLNIPVTVAFVVGVGIFSVGVAQAL